QTCALPIYLPIGDIRSKGGSPSMPPSANPFRWARLVNMPEFAPRAFRPITTPSPPRDSMFTPLIVPAVWPGEPLNHPIVNAPGPGSNIDHGMDAVEPRRR